MNPAGCHLHSDAQNSGYLLETQPPSDRLSENFAGGQIAQETLLSIHQTPHFFIFCCILMSGSIFERSPKPFSAEDFGAGLIS
ncbi:MAG: hypothetical protein ACFB12_21655 [Leptolyngbyaceae cyanobacterium]